MEFIWDDFDFGDSALAEFVLELDREPLEALFKKQLKEALLRYDHAKVQHFIDHGTKFFTSTQELDLFLSGLSQRDCVEFCRLNWTVAIKGMNVSLVQCMVDHGASELLEDLELDDLYDSIKIAIQEGSISMLQLLLDNCALREAWGGHFMCTAASFGNLDMVEMLLLQYEAPLDERDSFYKYGTPLLCAVENGHLKVAQALLWFGASMKKKMRFRRGQFVRWDDGSGQRGYIFDRGCALKPVQLALKRKNHRMVRLLLHDELFLEPAPVLYSGRGRLERLATRGAQHRALRKARRAAERTDHIIEHHSPTNRVSLAIYPNDRRVLQTAASLQQTHIVFLALTNCQWTAQVPEQETNSGTVGV